MAKKVSKDFLFDNTIKFLKKLKNNNNRDWFNDNRDLYEKDFLIPAQIFVEELGNELKKLSPNLNAIPKIDKSIFRLYRDTRFSKDKTPYKTHLGIYLWEGKYKKLECTGFYFHLEPDSFFIAVGGHMFPNEILKKYRNVVYQPEKAKDLIKIYDDIKKKKKYKLCEPYLKRIPSGFDSNYKYAALLQYRDAYAFYESKKIKELYATDPVKIASSIFRDLLPLHKWLLKNI